MKAKEEDGNRRTVLLSVFLSSLMFREWDEETGEGALIALFAYSMRKTGMMYVRWKRRQGERGASWRMR